MALLLCIDTALEKAFVGLCDGALIMASLANNEQKTHAAFVQSGIQSIMQSTGVSFQQIDAVAVVNGPGSYTGLRVGLATAKGICYAANKPLILINTLEVMALAATQEVKDASALYCPMIDARRNEVFAAIYNFFLQSVLHPQPLIIEEGGFADLLEEQKIYFSGSGHNKCKHILRHRNAFFDNIEYDLSHTNELAQRSYEEKQFAGIAYAEPFYTKEFFLPGK